MHMQPMVFEQVEVRVITKNGEHWVTASDVAKALGYKSLDAVSRIYRRNADEFTGTMTETVNLTASGNLQKTVRIFSLRGAHLIAMFARTPKAKAFRRWVLDILDTITRGGEYARQQWERHRQALEDRREQASEEGRGLAQWRWGKRSLEAGEKYWRDRMQLALPL